jgi:hypothetical protein
MTRTGVVNQLYGEHVEPRPFSRFTANDDEIAANAEWRCRALSWGSTHVSKSGWFSATEKVDNQQPLKGRVYYASKQAKRYGLYKEGESVTLTSYHSAHYISEHFVQAELDSSAQSYLHMTLNHAIQEVI